MKKVLLSILALVLVQMTFGQGGFGTNGSGQQPGMNMHGANGNGGYSAGWGGMSPREFAMLKQNIAYTRFDNRRLIIAKDAARNNGLSAGQIAEITRMFAFETSRLDFAKFAYAFCINPENYGVVNNSFQFSSSIAQLEQFTSNSSTLVVVSGGVSGGFGGMDPGHGNGHGHGHNAGNLCSHGLGSCQACSFNYIMPMVDCDFRSLLITIDKACFDSRKVTVILQALDYNYFTSAQVRSLMESLSFESSKLEVAKAGYDRVVDPHRYFIVNDAFSFSSSIRELDCFIRGHNG